MLSELTTSAAAVAAGVTFLLTVVGWDVSRRVASHTYRQGTLAALTDLTTGDVAVARNLVGTYMYGPDHAVSRISIPDLIRAYYTLSWAVERAAGAYEALRVSSGREREGLVRSLHWHVREVVTNLTLVRRQVEIEDDEAWGALTRSAWPLLGRPPRSPRDTSPDRFTPVSDEQAERLAKKRELGRRTALLN